MRRRGVLASMAFAVSAGCLGAPTALTNSELAADDGSCPAFDEDADRTVCAGADTSDASDRGPVSFVRSRSYLSPEKSAETLTFSLRNHSTRAFSFNPNGWEIRRWTGHEWRHVAPDVVFQPLYELPPGETYHWKLSLESSFETDDDSTYPVTESLDRGTYAFAVSGDLNGERIECVARFRVRSE